MFERLLSSPTRTFVAALVGVVWQTVSADAFFWLFCLLLASNACDWLAGRHAARRRDEFRRRASREGLVRKAIALAVVLIIRSFEAVLTMVGDSVGFPSTQGWAAAGVTAALILEDVQSLEEHGGRPIPLLSRVLAYLRDLTGADRRLDPDRHQPATPTEEVP